MFSDGLRQLLWKGHRILKGLVKNYCPQGVWQRPTECTDMLHDAPWCPLTLELVILRTHKTLSSSWMEYFTSMTFLNSFGRLIACWATVSSTHLHGRGWSNSKPTGGTLDSSETLLDDNKFPRHNNREVSYWEIRSRPRIMTFYSSVMVRHVDITEIDEGEK